MVFEFADFELDMQRCELRRGAELRHVEPQVFDVLAHLVSNRERLVTKDELIDSVWGHAFITPATLSSRIRAAREALGDDGTAQAFIRTIRGRGFRFVAPVEVREPTAPGDAEPAVLVADGSATSVTTERVGPRVGPPVVPAVEPAVAPDAPALVARSEELERLVAVLEEARFGSRRLAFVTGEPGIGKSTLAEALLARLPGDARVGVGQCVEQRGAGEPYLPVLDALGRLCRGQDGAALLATLERAAPTWLAQMPALVTPEQLEVAQRRALGATRERMLREMVEALELIARDTLLVLVLEDLHWSDPSTLDLVVWLARRPEAARLLVVATVRRSDSDTEVRTAMAEAARTGRAIEVALDRWGEDELGEYCRLRDPDVPFPDELVHLVHERTDGNPLFARTLVDAWVESGALVAGADGWRPATGLDALAEEVPDTLRVLVEHRVERLDPEDQEVLEAGSVAGTEFTAAVAAAALEGDEEEVEARCAALARAGRIVREAGTTEGPGRHPSPRFSFVHHLFREALYDRIPPTRRARFHLRVAERLEVEHEAGAPELAGELAMHSRLGRDDARAVRWLRVAAEQALDRSAHREAIAHMEAGLEILERRPDLPDALREELELQRRLGPALLITRGWGDPEAERAYRRAREISEQIDDAAQLAQVLHGMAYLHEIRGDFHKSEPILEKCLDMREQTAGPYTSIEANELLSCSFFHQGKFESALRCARSAMDTFQPLHRGDPFAASLGMNAAVAAYYWAGLALWCLGHPDQALDPLETGMRIAGSSQLIYMKASAHGMAAQLYQFRREVQPVVDHSAAALSIAEHQGYPFHQAVALTLGGWASVALGDGEEGVERIRRGLEMQQEAGADMERPYGLGLLADALLRTGAVDEALEAIDEGLETIRRRARTFFWEAELHRLRGEARLASGDRDEAEADFREALVTADRQAARSLGLRAATSLARLEGSGTNRGELRRLYDGFTEGHDTPDLRDARETLGISG